MFNVSDIFIYPVKSLGGFRVAEAKVTATGFEHDRRWMLVDKQDKFMTQRILPAMALLQTGITASGLYIYHKHFPEKNITIPFLSSTNCTKKVQVWEDICDAWCYDDVEMDAWFTEMLGIECELVYMPDNTKRLVDTQFANDSEVTSFSDGYPFLIIGQSSLDELNSKLENTMTMDRFRPNIVFAGGAPHAEDNWQHFSISEIDFFGVKTCSRCVVTTINQQTSAGGKEPLTTLATYRLVNKKIKFGMNLLHKGEGLVKTGDTIKVYTN